MRRLSALLFGLFLAPALTAADRPDVMIADFEGADYGDWKTTGDAFGTGPARGTLPQQMPVSGFLGKGLVNSYLGGDKSTGTLTSSSFKIERPFINFLIGGGKDQEKLQINLRVDGKVVRTATGPNDRPGGTEALDWHSWDVKDLIGQSASIEIVDRATGGWGHINIDHIIQSDRKRATADVSREFVIEKRYLNLPVKTDAPKRRVKFLVDDETVREFDIEFADGEPEFFAFADVSAFRGKKLRVEAKLPDGGAALDHITQSDEIAAPKLYAETHRPQFHFTARRGWLNDPNGLVYAGGEYHLFFQHNPYGKNWGNMHWGHAVSKDLVHWQELPVALYPKRYDDWAFSGSAVVDHKNTSGFGAGGKAPLVAAYTSTGRGECIAYSTDRGRTWKEYDGNPVVKHAGRDPKLVWYEPGQKWVMAVYDEHAGKQWIAFHTSSDLKKWEFQSRIEGYFECPDLFSLPVDGKAGAEKWVLYAADGKYAIGTFDGKTFTPDGPGKQQLWHGNFYAAQSYSNAPDGRRIQIGWGNGISFPDMPFNQQMTVPVQLTLRTTADGLRMFAEPVGEVDKLMGEKEVWTDSTLKPGDNPLRKVAGDLIEIRGEFVAEGADVFGFDVRGCVVSYDAKAKTLTCNKVAVPLAPVDGKIRLRVLLDRGSVEVFGNDGRVALSAAYVAPPAKTSLAAFARGVPVRAPMISVSEIRSAWDK
ncbi:glycoside hydrolase family 32 protein [Fimbriiglobus ruber]|uniref:Sucrose-6-phosphate hydrolase n=1 Tax=Fimbriiglobus ruber TaxID=1908690 RepID=A0A225E627_9BACT|nr:glycoside hydrolase family 32 protein [Fimbriiglobus ruber]OWK43877.1 Sucrose-6-phosphate hydrolase [Fimbriiglobus ruber]